MTALRAPRVLQVGLGGFGRFHLQAWQALGLLDSLTIAEMNPDRWEAARAAGVPPGRLTTDMRRALDTCDLVDIVTSTDSHFALCQAALQAGKDVFVEKPMTLTSADARQLMELAEGQQRLMQVGFYYRFHPISQELKATLQAGRLGVIRYLTGNFCGFKRARTDVGVMHTDGIHFLDLFNWLLEAVPLDVYAVCRDHFSRGLEDFALALLTYPGGVVAKVEAGYIQPGRWPDKVVPGAMTTKEITIVGDGATAEVDFESQTLTITNARHEQRNGIWTPTLEQPVRVQAASCTPAELVARELTAFLQALERREPTPAGPLECGWHLATLMEALYDSAQRGERIPIDVRPALTTST